MECLCLTKEWQEMREKTMGKKGVFKGVEGGRCQGSGVKLAIWEIVGIQ